MCKLRQKLKIKTFTIENVLKCMESVWQKILNYIFQTDATIESKADVHWKFRAQRSLY